MSAKMIWPIHSSTVQKLQALFSKDGAKKPARKTTRQVAEEMNKERHKKGKNFEADPTGQEAFEEVAKGIARDVRTAMSEGSDAVGWYSTHYQNAINVLAEEWPELKQDVPKLIFTAIMAVTSNGQSVLANFNMACKVYARYRETGEISQEGLKNIRGAGFLDKLDELGAFVDLYGADEAVKKLLEEDSVENLRKKAREMGLKLSSGYRGDEELPFAALILGEKVGAFFANLSGKLKYLTMDRWFSRSVNRYRGTLLPKVRGTENDPKQTQMKGGKEEKIGLARFKEMIGQPELSDAQAMREVEKLRTSYEAKGFKEGTPEEKAANTIWKAAFYELMDTPMNGADRAFMIQATKDAQRRLKRSGIDLSIADIQAVLWYYEKDLFAKRRGVKPAYRMDYSAAAKKVMEARKAGRELSEEELAVPGEDEEDNTVYPEPAPEKLLNEGSVR